MRDAEYSASRRRFLGQLFGIAASVALAPSALDALEQLAPRRLYVPAPRKLVVLDSWKEVKFVMTDEELAAAIGAYPLRAYSTATGAPLRELTQWADVALVHQRHGEALDQTISECASALRESLRPGTTLPPRVRLHYDAMTTGRHVVSIDQLGASATLPPKIVFAADDDPRDVVLPWASRPPHWQDISRTAHEQLLQERYERIAANLPPAPDYSWPKF